MIDFISEFIKRLLTALILMPLFIGAYLHSPLMFSLLLSVVLIIALFYEWPRLVSSRNKFFFFFISFFYPILPIVGLIFLDIWYRKGDIWLPLYPFLAGWTADTFGFFVGKTLGRHKMCPTISPGKTWEGFLGSFIGVFVLNYFVFPRIDVPPFQALGKSINTLLVLSLAITIVSFLGGFFISILKRRKELKDAGALLPGHGGILDRFDSVFFIVFFVWGLMFYPHRSKVTLKNIKQMPAKIMKKIKTSLWKGKKVAAQEEAEEGEEEKSEKPVAKKVAPPKKKKVEKPKEKKMPMAPTTKKKKTTPEKKEIPMASTEEEEEESEEKEEALESPKKLEKMPGI